LEFKILSVFVVGIHHGQSSQIKHPPPPPLKGVAIICVPLERDSNVFHLASEQRNKQNKEIRIIISFLFHDSKDTKFCEIRKVQLILILLNYFLYRFSDQVH